MKFSNNTLFYPKNHAIPEAIAYCTNLFPDLADEAKPIRNMERNAILQQNTLGRFEHQYSTVLLNKLREQLAAALTDNQREQAPLDWAAGQTHLGILLAMLGETQADVECLTQSIQAFKLALEIYTQADTPQFWAATQNHLGTVLQTLGQQENDAKRLKKSVDAHTAVLLELKRGNAPEAWALTMFHLGRAFHLHGQLLKGNRTFQKSVVAYKNALAEFNADRDPLEITASYNNRGAVLQNLGEAEDNADRLEEAIRSYEKALIISQEQQLPLHLSITVRANLAMTRNNLATLRKDVGLAGQTADDLELIVELFGTACHPDCLSQCQVEWDKSLVLIEELKN